MMADTYIALSDIKHDGKVVCKRGERVSKSGFSDEQFQQLIDGEAIVLEGSPAAFTVQAKVATEAGLTESAPKESTEISKEGKTDK